MWSHYPVMMIAGRESQVLTDQHFYTTLQPADQSPQVQSLMSSPYDPSTVPAYSEESLGAATLLEDWLRRVSACERNLLEQGAAEAS